MSEMRLHDPAGNRLYLNAEERAAFLAAARRQLARDRTLCEDQFHTVHLRFDAASAVVSGPVSPDGATEVFRRAKRLVARDCACCCGFPGLGIPSRRDDGMRTAVGDSVMALARVKVRRKRYSVPDTTRKWVVVASTASTIYESAWTAPKLA